MKNKVEQMTAKDQRKFYSIFAKLTEGEHTVLKFLSLYTGEGIGDIVGRITRKELEKVIASGKYKLPALE